MRVRESLFKISLSSTSSPSSPSSPPTTSLHLLLLLLLIILGPTATLQQQQNACKSSATGVCTCELADGRGWIDLSSLVTQSANKPYEASNGQYSYDYVFCGLVKDSTLPNCNGAAAVCEYSTSYNMDLGRPSTFRFQMRTSSQHSTPAVALVADSDNVDGTFRRSVAFLNCGKQNPPDYASYGYKSPDKDPDGYILYYMDFTGAALCPTSTPPGSGSDSLSPGSVMLIIFFSLAFVYFVGGFLFLTFYKKNQGIERLPNHQFWIDLPLFAKEGALYAWNMAKQLCNRR